MIWWVSKGTTYYNIILLVFFFPLHLGKYLFFNKSITLFTHINLIKSWRILYGPIQTSLRYTTKILKNLHINNFKWFFFRWTLAVLVSLIIPMRIYYNFLKILTSIWIPLWIFSTLSIRSYQFRGWRIRFLNNIKLIKIRKK
jgi:hypothetical protein